MQKVLSIVGPTAVGKTSLSLKLAHDLNGEIISGDSMQVYRNLNIGTAKIMPSQMKGINHHLIDIKNVNERYSVANFVSDAKKSIHEINQKNKLPIIVGGTGFYIQALLNNFELGGDYYSNDHKRIHLENYADEYGNKNLWKRLYRIDPKAAQKIPFNNERRVIRALEVYYNTGHLFSDQHYHNSIFDAYLLCLNTDRKLLYQRINKRVNLMIKNGLLNEAKWLYKRGGINLPAGKGIGYREFNDYFNNKQDLNQTVYLIKRDSRHYAKRQLTWFRNKMNVHWYDLINHPNEIETIKNNVNEWLNK